MDSIKHLKDKFRNKKALIFSCGDNIKEHRKRFNEFEKSDFIKCCWKSSCRFLNYNCDILGVSTNTEIDDIKKVDCPIIEFGTNYVKNSIKIQCTKTKFDQNFKRFYEKDGEIVCQGFFAQHMYNFIMFLNLCGVKEFYLFGFYNNHTFLNILDYNYYDDLLRDTGHWYDKEKSRTFEWGGFVEQLNSSKIGKLAKKSNIKLFNVSSRGCLSNSIPRITFDSIFLSEKVFIERDDYIDLCHQLDKNFDKDFYSKEYQIKPKNCLYDYIYYGIYLNRKINKDDKKNVISINKNLEKIIYSLMIMKNSFNFDNKRYSTMLFFYHFVNYFDSVFEVKFFNSIDLISSDIFLDVYVKNNNISSFMKTELYNILIEEYKIKNKNCEEYIDSLAFAYILFHKYKLHLPEDFNWETYINNYPDLKKKIKNEKQAIRHYINHGKSEKRKYK